MYGYGILQYVRLHSCCICIQTLNLIFLFFIEVLNEGAFKSMFHLWSAKVMSIYLNKFIEFLNNQQNNHV